jgi:hypothetical protein
MNRQNKWRHFILVALALSILTIFTAVVLETMLHVAARLTPRIGMILFQQPVEILQDAELGNRGNPTYPEHDKNGFRNPLTSDTADIVAIGDSQTYGTSVDFQTPWPRVLEKISSCQVYSMALPGYGPLQYALLARRAARFKPRLILIGIYFGNDLYDNWQMYLRNPSKYLVPEDLLRPALERERHNPLSRDVEEFFTMGQTDVQKSESASAWWLRRFLSQHSAIWGFGRAIKNQLLPPNSVLSAEFRTAVAALTPTQLEYASIFEGADWSTIFTSRYRDAAENYEDPRIQVGYWLTQWAIQDIDQLAKQNGISLMFILLPTKESVFAPKVKNASEHKFFEKLTTEENRFRHSLIRYLEENGIAYIDMTPPLRSMAQQPYFENADGHPNAIGHKAIASRVLEHIGVCKR